MSRDMREPFCSADRSTDESGRKVVGVTGVYRGYAIDVTRVLHHVFLFIIFVALHHNVGNKRTKTSEGGKKAGISLTWHIFVATNAYIEH